MGTKIVLKFQIADLVWTL